MKITRLSFTHDLINPMRQGRKTSTRRPLNIKEGWQLISPDIVTVTSNHRQKGFWGGQVKNTTTNTLSQTDLVVAPCLKGDLAYVVEPFAILKPGTNTVVPFSEHQTLDVRYRADEPKDVASANTRTRGYPWMRAKFMPRKLSRFTLDITDVRIERLQDITPEQALREGVTHHSMACPIAEFAQFWNGIYNSWEQNPWVWAIEFEVIPKNIDTYLMSTHKEIL